MQRDGAPFHGFALAAELAKAEAARELTAHGTLYKALARLTESGLLEAAWEDPAEAAVAGRPRRKLYRVTSDGAIAVAAAHEQRRSTGAPAFGAASPAGGAA